MGLECMQEPLLGIIMRNLGHFRRGVGAVECNPTLLVSHYGREEARTEYARNFLAHVFLGPLSSHERSRCLGVLR